MPKKKYIIYLQPIESITTEIKYPMECIVSSSLSSVDSNAKLRSRSNFNWLKRLFKKLKRKIKLNCY